MFSYRHAFHAGNHADVLKHVVLIQSLDYLTQKETPLLLIDTHAGVGLYSLDGEYASKSEESQEGVMKLWEAQDQLPSGLQRYIKLLHRYNPEGRLTTYPGSPLIMHDFCRTQDRLHLFELHPVDQHELLQTIKGRKDHRHIQVHISDGFKSLKALLPPVSRRGLILMDPSYELKTDYQQVVVAVEEGMKRFATGVYLVWYPCLNTVQSQQLPEQLMKLAQNYQRQWLHATLSIRDMTEKALGLQGSGVFVINPPYALQSKLEEALTHLVSVLQAGQGAQYTLVRSEF